MELILANIWLIFVKSWFLFSMIYFQYIFHEYYWSIYYIFYCIHLLIICRNIYTTDEYIVYELQCRSNLTKKLPKKISLYQFQWNINEIIFYILNFTHKYYYIQIFVINNFFISLCVVFLFFSLAQLQQFIEK